MIRARGGYTQHLGLSVLANIRRRRIISDLSAGYTIIEVMIVLAVSSVMFFAATTLLANKQGKTEFSQAMRDIETQIQSVVNDVGVSRYPATDSLCETNPATGRPRLVNSPGGGIGTSQECLFLGKAIFLDAQPSPKQLRIYSVLSRSTTPGGAVITNFEQATPEPMMSEFSTPHLTEFYTLPFGVSIVSATQDIPVSSFFSPTYMMGFYNSLQNQNSTPGSQSIKTIGYAGVRSTSSAGTRRAAVRETTPLVRPVDSKAWIICLQSGTSSERARLTINASSSGITTKLDFINCT
jgi:prepilin-type N-terminal cleavage/methylation domain-containing protein